MDQTRCCATDSLEVPGERVHARPGSTLHITSNDNGQHGPASLISTHANKVESSNGGVEAQPGGIKNDADLGSNLHDRD
jgi:hypothetical protein